jgi:hypothetical protein
MPALLSGLRPEFLLGWDQLQAPVAAETQRRVMRLRMSPTTGFWFDLIRQLSAVQSARIKYPTLQRIGQ